MPKRFVCAACSIAMTAATFASAQAPDPCQGADPIVIEGTVPEGPETHFFVSFEVPEGIVEIVVCHDNPDSANILDWGLDDPNGFRGWGGGNSEPAIVGVEAASRSYVPGPIPAGTWEVVVGKARIEKTPAPYEIEIFLHSEATLFPQPRTPYQDPGVLEDEARWYAGDFHVHSRQSGDATPTISENLDLARQVGLDFVMLSEHNTNSGLTLYGDVQPEYPDVLIVPGVEWTTYSGHGNAIGATEWVDHKIGVRGVTADAAIEAYREQGALFSINHPTVPGGNFCIGCPWEIDSDPAMVDGVEVQGGIWEAIDFWEEQIEAGSRAAAIGGSDDHRAGGATGSFDSQIGRPTTMVFAKSLSVSAIVDGVRAGRTVVKVKGPDEPMLETELSGQRMGDTVFADEATLSATVTGGEEDTLWVIKNGVIVDRVPITSDPFTHERQVAAPANGEDRYRHQVVFGTTAKTIGSYVWLRAAGSPPPDGGTPDGGSSPSDGSSGCSCGVVSPFGGDTAWLVAVIAPFLLWLRRRRFLSD